MSILGLVSSTKLNWTMGNQHSSAVEEDVFDYDSRCHFIDEKPTLSSTLRFKINFMLLICLTIKSHHLTLLAAAAVMGKNLLLQLSTRHRRRKNRRSLRQFSQKSGLFQFFLWSNQTKKYPSIKVAKQIRRALKIAEEVASVKTF